MPSAWFAEPLETIATALEVMQEMNEARKAKR